MSAYATAEDVQERMTRDLSDEETALYGKLLEDAAVIIDSYNKNATADAKKVVSCRMVIRALGDGEGTGYPMGATQGSMTALGYTQSWTMSGGGSSGDMYIGKTERQILGLGQAIGARRPLEGCAHD